MEAISMDLRKRVLEDCDAGQGTKAVAAKYRVSPAWVRRLKQRRRENNEIAPRKPGGHRPVLIDRSRLRELVQNRPDATLAELRDALGIKCSLSGICMALQQLKITFKKR